MGSRILIQTCLVLIRMLFLLYYEGYINRGLSNNCLDQLYNESDEGTDYFIILRMIDTILVGSLLLENN